MHFQNQDYLPNISDLLEDIKPFIINQNILDDYTQKNKDEIIFHEIKKNNSQLNVSSQPKKSDKVEPVENEIIYPREKDTLFWCYYIMKNGLDEYLHIPHRNMVFEKQLKIELIEKLRENKTFIKVNKLGPLTHIENFLLNESSIDMKTFYALCCFENISCILLFSRFFCDVNIDENEDDPNNNIMMLINNKELGKFGFKKNVKQEEVSLVRNTQYKIDNLAKPIKAMTAYKMEELDEISKKLKIELPEKYRKKDIYELIVQALS